MDVQLDQAAMRALAESPEVAAAVKSKAEEAKSIAEGLSAEFAKTGEYESSFNVRSYENTHLSPRASSILENTSDHAQAVEWGNKRFPNPHRVLARTKDAMEGG